MNTEIKNTMDQYADEVRRRWGDTDAYKESERRTVDYTARDWGDLSEGMDAVMAGFAALKADGATPDSEQAKAQVEALKAFITDRMYTCTDEILAGLGQMYVADEQFLKNIDRRGEGTAAYIAACIRSFCDRQNSIAKSGICSQSGEIGE